MVCDSMPKRPALAGEPRTTPPMTMLAIRAIELGRLPMMKSSGSAEDVAEAADDPDAGDEVTGHQVAADRDRADLRVAVERKNITGVAGEDAHPLALGDRELADGDIRGRRGRRLAARGEGHTRDVRADAARDAAFDHDRTDIPGADGGVSQEAGDVGAVVGTRAHVAADGDGCDTARGALDEAGSIEHGISGVDAPADEVVADLHHAHVVLAENPAAVASRPAAERAADGTAASFPLHSIGPEKIAFPCTSPPIVTAPMSPSVTIRALLLPEPASSEPPMVMDAIVPLDICGGRPRAAEHVAADPYRARACRQSQRWSSPNRR